MVKNYLPCMGPERFTRDQRCTVSVSMLDLMFPSPCCFFKNCVNILYKYDARDLELHLFQL